MKTTKELVTGVQAPMVGPCPHGIGSPGGHFGGCTACIKEFNRNYAMTYKQERKDLVIIDELDVEMTGRNGPHATSATKGRTP